MQAPKKGGMNRNVVKVQKSSPEKEKICQWKEEKEWKTQIAVAQTLPSMNQIPQKYNNRPRKDKLEKPKLQVSIQFVSTAEQCV